MFSIIIQSNKIYVLASSTGLLGVIDTVSLKHKQAQ